MTIQIEKGIPVPVSDRRHKYPLLRMTPGDSFFVPVKEGQTIDHCAQLLRSSVSQHTRRHGGNFIVRRVEGGVRCWKLHSEVQPFRCATDA